MWLLAPTAKQTIEQFEKIGMVPTAEQQRDFEARVSSRGEVVPVLIGGGKAEIIIEGVLTNRPSYLAMLFGGGNTTYQDIIAAVAKAEQEKSVEEIVLTVGSSPGGHIDGLFEAIASLQAAKKPITAVVSDQAASATYALVAQADKIVVKNRGTRVGSIGVAIDAHKSPNAYSIVSEKAPKKRPDVSTEEGRAIVREELDAIHTLFADSIATGRNVSASTVNAEFGQGAMVLAEEAIKRGMVDELQAPEVAIVSGTRSTTANSGGAQLEASKMDQNEFMAKHPDLFQAVLAKGVAKERDRVTAHLIMGKQSGDMETAVAAVENGDEMTATLQAKYMTFGMNRSDVEARGADEGAAGATDDADTDDETQTETVVSAIEKKCGIKAEV